MKEECLCNEKGKCGKHYMEALGYRCPFCEQETKDCMCD